MPTNPGRRSLDAGVAPEARRRQGGWMPTNPGRRSLDAGVAPEARQRQGGWMPTDPGRRSSGSLSPRASGCGLLRQAGRRHLQPCPPRERLWGAGRSPVRSDARLSSARAGAGPGSRAEGRLAPARERGPNPVRHESLPIPARTGIDDPFDVVAGAARGPGRVWGAGGSGGLAGRRVRGRTDGPPRWRTRLGPAAPRRAPLQSPAPPAWRKADVSFVSTSVSYPAQSFDLIVIAVVSTNRIAPVNTEFYPKSPPTGVPADRFQVFPLTDFELSLYISELHEKRNKGFMNDENITN